MATVTGLTAAKMQEISDQSVISGSVVDGVLILHTRGGADIEAGSVEGPVGPSGSGFVICTSTTRPSFSSGEIGKAIFETDTLLIRVWTGLRFKLQERIICLSSARPAMEAEDVGVEIYEMDTGLTFVWTGTSWFMAGSQAVPFATSAARNTAWPSPPDGALSFLQDNPASLWLYDNSQWNSVGVPPGVMSPFIGSAAPLNWVLMYGQTITNAETLYPTLWANTAAQFKSGSNLVVPDLRGRIPVAPDNMGGSDANRLSSSNTLGTTGGASAVTLSTAQIPSHVHSLPDHAHWLSDYWKNGGTWGVAEGSTHWFDLSVYSGGITAAPNSGPQGGNQSHENMPPFITINWILKIV